MVIQRIQLTAIAAAACLLSVASAHGAAPGVNPIPQDALAKIQPGDVLQDHLSDGTNGPTLVVVPSGEFSMGSPAHEAGRYDNEGPQHEVNFLKPFAMGRTEVTVGQFRAFVKSTGYMTVAEQNNGSLARDARTGEWLLNRKLNWRLDHEGNPAADDFPVVHVAWQDAYAYTRWLSEETGLRYRLPSEAELEYANRAGTRTAYWWGDNSPGVQVANLRGELDLPSMPPATRLPTFVETAYAFREGATPAWFNNYGDGFGGLSPVASFEPNSFGLYDTTGNVWEWSQDCWHDDYNGAPADGRAWESQNSGNCGQRVLRGGSWYCFPRHLRSANRWSEVPTFRNMYTGFRVVREL